MPIVFGSVIQAPADSFNHRMAIADLIRCAAEPALFEGHYSFAESGLVPLLNDKLLYLHSSAEPQRIPPADVLFLHRKLAGIFLLCARIRAQVDVRSILLAHLEMHRQRGKPRAGIKPAPLR